MKTRKRIDGEKKNPRRVKTVAVDSVPPKQALQFLEDMRVLYSTKDEATRAISLRVPENLLRLVKTRAEVEGKKYQSLIIEILREGLRPKSSLK